MVQIVSLHFLVLKGIKKVVPPHDGHLTFDIDTSFTNDTSIFKEGNHLSNVS